MRTTPDIQTATDEVYVFPASFAQQRLWLIDQIATEKAAYNMSGSLELHGHLDVEALEKAFNEIIRRHETLRTTFDSDDGQPIQMIAPSLSIKVKLVDLQHVPEKDRRDHALEKASAEALIPFDLAHGPLIRIHLYRLAPRDHMLVMTMHHIIGDAWSVGLLMEELSALYAALIDRRPGSLPELPVQYADYAEWQREWLKSGVLEQQLAFWKKQLRGAPTDLALPTDRPRPATKSFHGALECRTIPLEQARKLKALAQREGVTLFMLSLAAFSVLLNRYTAQTDVVIGSPITNRTRIELEKLIGFFLNTLVLRLDLAESPSFREVLRRTRDVCLQAFGNQDLPFEKLVEELQPDRSLGQNPIFQVMFVFQNEPLSNQQLPGLTLQPLSLRNRTSKFDLTLFMEETADGMLATFEYDTDLFERSTVERMALHFETLLDSLTRAPDLPIGRLNWLGESERKTLLEGWNQTEAPYPRQLPVHTLFEQQAAKTPNADAAIFENETISYRELNERSHRLARLLRSKGVGPGSHVAICLERSLEMLVAVLGTLKSGAAYVPLDAAYPKERLAFMLEDSNVRILLSSKRLLGGLPRHGVETLCLDEPVSDSVGGVPDSWPGNPNPKDPAYVIYTSGSTGKPKGVAMPHGPLVNLITWQLGRSKVGSGRTLQFSPLSFDVSFQELFSTWAGGGTLVLVRDEVRRDPTALLELLTKQRIERLFLPFVALQQLAEGAETANLHPESLREIITAGETLQITPAILKWFKRLRNCTLCNQYGPTESHVVTAEPLEGDPESWPARPSIGKPISNARIYILDADLQPVPVGVPGELAIGGEVLARDYLNRPDLSAERFLPDPFTDAHGARIYRTGDLARYLPDGRIDFLGRLDHQVKIRGYRVELGEIEAVLCRHSEVREAVAVVRGRAPNQKLTTYFVPRAEPPPEPETLREFLKQRLPDYMVPARFVPLDKLPLTPSGKVDRRALPEPAPDRKPDDRAYVAPRSDNESRLATIWEELLQLPRVGIQDNFFEIGGHSLLAVRLFAKIKNTFGKQLPLTALFKAPTIQQLAALIREEDESKTWATLVPIQPNGSRPPVFWAHTLGGGGGGGLFRYKSVAEKLGPSQPSFGIQAPQEPFGTLETMAEHYNKVIQAKQPEGPYYLAGFCFGGNVAYEMARQLSAQGQKVAMLALIESWAPRPRRIKLDWMTIRDFTVNLMRWFRALCHQNPRLIWRRFSYRLHRFKKHLGHREQERAQPALDEIIRVEEYPEGYLRHAEVHWQALTHYDPKPYPGPVTAFRVRGHGLTSYDSTLRWRFLCSGPLEVRTIPGTHDSLFDGTNVEILAAEMIDALDRARARYGDAP